MGCSVFFGFLLGKRFLVGPENLLQWLLLQFEILHVQLWVTQHCWIFFRFTYIPAGSLLQPTSASLLFFCFVLFFQSANTAAKFEGFGKSDPKLMPSRDTTVRWMMAKGYVAFEHRAQLWAAARGWSQPQPLWAVLNSPVPELPGSLHHLSPVLFCLWQELFCHQLSVAF